MARIRRPKTINGSEYTFGGGSAAAAAAGAVGGLVKIAKGNMNTANANHDGFLSSGDTILVRLDASTDIPTKDQYIYFDNAFETENGQVTYEFMNGDTALPAGVSFAANTDANDSDTGEARFYGTPTVTGTNSFRVKVTYPSGAPSEQIELIYTLGVNPAGTTPVWGSTLLPSQIVRNKAGDQALSSGPTTSYAGATYTLSNVSGFAPGVVPTIDSATGDVVVSNVGDLIVASSTHAYTVNADLGEFGVYTQTYSGSIRYGDPYDAIYWGPGNAKVDPEIYRVDTGGNRISTAQYDALWNHGVKAGALRCRYDNNLSTSPYRYNESFGLTYNESWGFSSGSVGYLGPKTSSTTNTSANGNMVKMLWTVPPGLTKFSAVAIGAGAGGAYTWANDGAGGGGLAWINEVTCTPGEQFEIAVGIGRRSNSTNSSYWAGSSWIRRVTAAGYGANEWIIIGYGGGYQNGQVSPLNGRSNPDSSNLQFVEAYSNNNNRDGGSAAASTNYGTRGVEAGGRAAGRGGGGAAGYVGAGANSNNNNGTGGSAGAGNYYSSTYGCSAGGGVGLDGQGAGGADGVGSGYGGNNNSYTTNTEADGTNNYYTGGGGGSGGSRGCYGENNQTSNGGVQNRYINGGMHGGGGGGSGTSYGGGAGGMGGVRIIWGIGSDANGDPVDRAFPYTFTTEDPTIADSRNPGDGR